MNKTLFGAIMFVAGAAIGSAATYKFVKTKYERISREEIDDVKEYYRNINNEAHADESEVEDCDSSELENDEVEEARPSRRTVGEKPDLTHYADLIAQYRAEEEAFENQNKQKGGDSDMEYDDPYVISPDDFDENNSYDRIGLTYYADGTVVDDCDEVLDDDEIDVQIGRDWVNSFGEYGDDDVIHVRNEQSKTDYEIVRDPRKYSEAYPIIPRQVDC